MNVQNRGGWTPLIYAASAGQKAALEVLLKHGAAVNVQNCQGRTAAIVAAMYGHDSCLALLKKVGLVCYLAVEGMLCTMKNVHPA